jgi:hypothetical protein
MRNDPYFFECDSDDGASAAAMENDNQTKSFVAKEAWATSPQRRVALDFRLQHLGRLGATVDLDGDRDDRLAHLKEGEQVRDDGQLADFELRPEFPIR